MTVPGRLLSPAGHRHVWVRSAMRAIHPIVPWVRNSRTAPCGTAAAGPVPRSRFARAPPPGAASRLARAGPPLRSPGPQRPGRPPWACARSPYGLARLAAGAVRGGEPV